MNFNPFFILMNFIKKHNECNLIKAPIHGRKHKFTYLESLIYLRKLKEYKRVCQWITTSILICTNCRRFPTQQILCYTALAEVGYLWICTTGTCTGKWNILSNCTWYREHQSSNSSDCCCCFLATTCCNSDKVMIT